MTPDSSSAGFQLSRYIAPIRGRLVRAFQNIDAYTRRVDEKEDIVGS